MSLRPGFKSEAEAIAREVRSELHLPPVGRLDPQALAEHLAIPVKPLTTSGLPRQVVEHFTRIEPEAFSAITVFRGHERVIVHNDAHAPTRQASDITHELAHGLLHHTPSPALDEYGCRVWHEDQEDEADYLCGCLLVTRKAALMVAREGVALDSAARHYGVSVQMMSWRVNGTGARLQVQREKAARRRRTARK
jgi:hypothetical protein